MFFFIRNLYYDFHAQVGDGMPSSEASVPDTDAADMDGVTGRGEGGREGVAEEEEEWEREVDDLYHWTQELSFEDIR